MTTTEEQRLGQDLLRGKLLTESQLKTIEEYRASLGGRFQDIAVKLGFVPEERLNLFLEHRDNTRQIDLSNCRVDLELVAAVPRELLEKHGVLPLPADDGVLLVMGALDLDALEEFQAATQQRVQVGLAPTTQIANLVGRCFAELEELASRPPGEELVQKITDPVVAAMARVLVDADVLDPEAWERELSSRR